MSKKSWTSLHERCGLVFFIIVLLTACRSRDDAASEIISIRWKDGRAAGLSIAKHGVKALTADSLASQLKIVLAADSNKTSIAGDYHTEADLHVFEPLIPFTRGLTYQVWTRERMIGEIEIPKSQQQPQLLSIFPSMDTLPENLLKVYLLFSHPMQEGHSLQYISLTDHQGNKLTHSFLNLQSELWNEDRTVLTLWLDPGRIKRDLQPNKSEGAPLVKGNSYQLIVAAEWPDQEGNALGQSYTKKFEAVIRDSISPSTEQWTLHLPSKETRQALEVTFEEPLDYLLLMNALSMTDGNGNKLNGSIRVDSNERKFYFTPDNPWASGQYRLRIESRLADLAGNNLNRLFDVDLGNANANKPGKEIYERKWRID